VGSIYARESGYYTSASVFPRNYDNRKLRGRVTSHSPLLRSIFVLQVLQLTQNVYGPNY